MISAFCFFVRDQFMNSTISTSRVLSGYNEIASFLGVSTKTIQRNLSLMPVSKLGTKVVVLESDLVNWLQKRSKLIQKHRRSQ